MVTVDGEGFRKVELDAGAVFEHAEADFVAAFDGLGKTGSTFKGEVIVEEVVVGAVRAVGAAEDFGAGGPGRRRGDGRCGTGVVRRVREAWLFARAAEWP